MTSRPERGRRRRSCDDEWVPGRGWLRCGQMAAGACLVMTVPACTSSGSSGQASGTRPSAAVSASAGTSGDGSSVAPGGPGQVLPCSASIGSRPGPDASYQVVVQNVAVPAAPVLQVSFSGETDPAVGLVAKRGPEVRAGAAGDLWVAPGL